MPKKRIHDPVQKRQSHLRNNYLWDISIFDHVLMMQGGGCKLCGSTERLCVDHSHESGHPRGILCNNCNLSIGYAKDNITTLENAIEYLTEHA